MRLFADLAYRGSAFHGWQIQPDDISVQETIEKALERLCGAPVKVTGAGRTDAGVNASRMIAHFDVPETKCDNGDTSGLLKALASMCGRDIAIYSLTRVADDAHARFDACARIYRYFVRCDRDPFTQSFVWNASRPLDFEAMNLAASLMLGKRDFTSFSKLHSSAVTNVCHLRKAAWHQVEGWPGVWCLEIESDRFLRNMVRAIAGTLVEVGRRARPPQWVTEVIERKDRGAAGTSMPGEALFLHDVIYPPQIYTPPFRLYGMKLRACDSKEL